MMKKTVGFLAVIMLLLGAMTLPALATDNCGIDGKFYFNCGFQTTSTTTYHLVDNNGGCFHYKNSTLYGNPNRIYVHHTPQGVSTEYTNYFRAIRKDTGAVTGTKWATPGLFVPIQGTSIVDGPQYILDGRGNTKHWENDGITSFSLNGYYAVNKFT